MAVKKIEELNIHRDVNSTEQFDVQGYLNENWDKMQDVIDNNAEELMQVQKDINTLKEDNKTNKSSIDVLEKSNETRDGKISKNAEDIEAIQGSIKAATETINKKDNEQDEDIKANKESIKEIQAENERLREDIKSIAVVNEVSGENIHIEDSSDARCEIEIDGNQQQDTREGYNKLDSSEFINSTQNGVTLKVNLDGTLTLNGTATADTTFRILRTQKLIVGKENLKVIINQLENAIKTGTIRLVCQDENYENTIYSQIGTSTFYNNLKEGITYNIFSLVVSSGTICNNFKLGLVISENKTDYEMYGASPSIDYPSKVKSVNGSAKIDIFNKNFIDIDKLKSLNSRNAYEKYNNVECLKLAGVTQRYNLNCKQNTQYVFQVNIVGYTYTGKLIGQFLIAYTDGSASYMQTDGINVGKYSLISKAGKTVKALVWNGYSSGHFVYIDKNDIQLDEATTLTNIVQHEEQSYLVDVQQPMFKGDTFIRQDGKWYEKHCVKTEIMSTFPTTNIEVCGTFANFQTNRNIAFAVVRDDLKITNVRNDILCDKLKAKANSVWDGKENGIQTYLNSNKIAISIPFEDIENFFGEELTTNNYNQAFRKYINDNGPFKIYYELAEPILLECTEAQSKVLDEIYNKAHTYKNITNILAESSEVNPIVNVKYLKDTETEHNKLQVQIDEIKQLLSSTETSALLVNNLEKDLRMEVE